MDPAVDMARTVRAREDLDWLPPSFKAVRWLVAGGIWTGITSVLVLVIFIAKYGFWIYGKGLALLFAGGYYAGDRAAKAVLRRRLSALAHGDVELARLGESADGELVHVRGTVRAIRRAPSLLAPAACVLRRIEFTVGGDRWVHEAGCNFHLVCADGEDVLVEVADARVVAASPKRRKLEGELARAVFNLTLDPTGKGGGGDLGLRISRQDRGEVQAGELLIQDGDEVEIVGYKSRNVDPTVAARMERDTPMRVTLRGGPELPLLVSPSVKPAPKLAG